MTAKSSRTSAFVSVIGRGFDGLDIQSVASELEATFAPVDDLGTDLGTVLENVPEGNLILQGTGVVDFDAKAAAALGLPFVLISNAPARTAELALEHARSVGATVVGALTDVSSIPGALASQEDVEPRMCAELFQKQLLDQAREVGAHIVLPEGEDDRILEAAGELIKGKVAKLTILGDENVEKRAQELGINLDGVEIINHLESPLAEEFAADFAELRKKKGVTLEQARETMQDVSYFATMMVHKGLADGMVSGAAHTTAHTIKPSFQIIKTAPGSSVVSSIFLMVMDGVLWAFGDCAVNPNPTPEQLAEIAAVSAQTAKQFGIEPKVAMLSYSTGASGAGEDVESVVKATELAQQNNPELSIDGPLQFDAAVVESVGQKKLPGSDVAGKATVFIFPDLNTGNITYKAVQRTADALAVGPILQGLNKPVNDLSRGATVPDIVNTVAITAIQAK